MRTRISIVSIIVAAIFLGSCAAPQKKVVTPEPITKEKAPTKPVRIGDLNSKLTDLTNQIINSLTETRKSRIAVIDFSDLEGNVTEFGKYLSEELITRLFKTLRFEVVERRMLIKVIKEHKLSYTHFFDEESVKDIGKFLGVDAIASGSVSDLGGSVKVNARLIDTETGSIFAVAAVEFLKDEKVARLLEKKAKTPERAREEEAKYYLRIYNIDDEGSAYINGELIKIVGYRGDSGWLDITRHLKNGHNKIRFVLRNGPQGWTYGFKLRKNKHVIWKDQCGEAGRWGCKNNDYTQGIVFDKSIDIVW